MKKIFILSLLGLMSFACTDLDVAPKNIIGDEALLTNASGMEIYLARMYSNMPFEDFKYRINDGGGDEMNQSYLTTLSGEGEGESLHRNGFCRTYTGGGYWGDAFKLLRDANYLLENLPTYKGSFAEPTYNHYLGEAYFVRAFVFYKLAARYGGIPLVKRVIQYPAAQDVLEEPRATEEETWNQVLADFDQAATLLSPKSLKSGYANKYVALSFKSEAMLYAGSVAKYNETVTGRLTGFGDKTGVRVMGFASDAWEAASKKYFKEAYTAAREVINNGGYSLYKKKWTAGDREAQYQNMVDMFSDLSSPENIYVRQYVYPTFTHGFDAYSSIFSVHSPLSAGVCPTLDFVELFEGFPRYPDGSIKVTDGNSNTDGNYLLYEKPMDFFANAEPRLRAYVIFPGDLFRGKEVEIRAGVYTGATPVQPFFTDYSYAATDRYQQSNAFKDSKLLISPRENSQQVLVPYDKNGNGTIDAGDTITASGVEGPFPDQAEATLTGLYGRKWLNTDPSFVPDEGKSAQPYILMRYAEVLLNAAEAAVELALASETSPDGANLAQVATEAVNAIRERAGASLLSGNITLDDDGRNTVRKERRKEFFCEYKARWDIRRWRVQHEEGRDYFWGEYKDKNTFSSNSQYRFRGLYPFFSTQARKYFFDARWQWVAQKTFGYSTIDYYFAIPGGEVSKSLVIDQQPNR